MDKIIGSTDEKQVLQAVINVIKKTCEKDVVSYCHILTIDRNTNLRLDLELDSISLVVLQINLEDVFGIQFDPLKDDFEKIFCTVESVYQFVLEGLKERSWDD